jgi:hypothetical protein
MKINSSVELATYTGGQEAPNPGHPYAIGSSRPGRIGEGGCESFLLLTVVRAGEAAGFARAGPVQKFLEGLVARD